MTLQSGTTSSKGRVTFSWSEQILGYKVFQGGKCIDFVGLEYSEKNPNWKQHVRNKYETKSD